MIQIQSIAFTSYNLGLHCDYSFLRICNAKVMSQGICNPHHQRQLMNVTGALQMLILPTSAFRNADGQIVSGEQRVASFLYNSPK